MPSSHSPNLSIMSTRDYPEEWRQEAFSIPAIDGGAFDEDSLNLIFDEFDADNKDFLSRSDLRRVMNVIDEAVTEEDLEQMMKLMDPQGTGVIMREQFIDVYMNPIPLFHNPDIEPGSAVGLPIRRTQADSHHYSVDDVQSQLNRASEERRLLYDEVMAQGTLKPSDIKKIFSRFQAIDTKDRGKITYPDFLIAMQREDSESSERFFNLCDKDGSGEIDLREFVLALSQLTDSSRDDRVKFAFKLFDTDNSGYIDRHELASIVKSAAPTAAMPQWINKRVGELYESVDLEYGALIDLDTFVHLARKNPSIIAPVIDIVK